MQVKPIPEEDRQKLAILTEKLAIVRREAEEAYLLSASRRQEVSKLQDELTLLKRDISIKVGGNTNWGVDDEGAHIVALDTRLTSSW